MNAGDTLPRLLWRNAARWPARPAWRQKRLGIWQTTNWFAFAARTGEIARGLAAWGFGPGARLAVLGDNRPDLYAALLAAQALGGVGVPLDPETDPTLLAVLLRACAPAVVLAETAEQAGWLRPLAPVAARVVAAERSGLHANETAGQTSLATLVAAGQAPAGDPLADLPGGALEGALAAGRPDDCALLLYPASLASAARADAGAVPRPVALSHARLLAAAAAIAAADPPRPTDEAFCYLPMASWHDAVYSLALGLLYGFVCNCPEAPDQVPRDIREIGPTILFASPAACTALARQVMDRSAAASPLKRRSFRFFQALALHAELLREQGHPIPPGVGFGCRVGELLAYGPARDQLGLSRARWVHAGAPVPVEPARLLRALGVKLRPGAPAVPAESTEMGQGEALHA